MLQSAAGVMDTVRLESSTMHQSNLIIRADMPEKDLKLVVADANGHQSAWDLKLVGADTNGHQSARDLFRNCNCLTRTRLI